MTTRTRSRLTLGVLSSALGLVATMTASSAGVTSAGSYGGSSAQQPTSPGKTLETSVVSVTPIGPGRPGTVTVKVTNPNQQAVEITRMSGTVTRITTGNRAGLQSCDPAWIKLHDFVGARPVTGKGTTALGMPVTFDNKPDVNQDNCKGVTYTFSFTVDGRQVR